MKSEKLRMVKGKAQDYRVSEYGEGVSGDGNSFKKSSAA
ncbi:hypothetical protein SC09_Contig17orf00306 [Bacillus subtilis]|uniref:Uncharacterized protein n=1 Tax=Bacillus subtilis TaxID=1423 RepID=A0A0D1IV31_BACIU|nr:hypothetical protein SC09_Contig17orf00306 [Bacillus subtilis]